MMFVRRPMRAKCPKCKKLFARFYDLRRHARGVHGVPMETMSVYLGQARALNKRRRLLWNIQRKKNAGQGRTLSSFSVSLAKDKLARNSQESRKGGTQDTPSGFLVTPTARSPDTKRLRKAEIAQCGFLSDFQKLCPIARCYQQMLVSAHETSEATAKQFAGLFNRFLDFAHDNFKSMTPLEALLSNEVADYFVDKYAKFFAHQSTVNAIIAVKKALTLMRYNATFKKETGLLPGMEAKLTRVIDQWTYLKRSFMRKLKIEQRVKIMNSGVKDWTGFFPISLALEYLSKARRAFLNETDDAQEGGSGLTVEDSILALRSTCALILVLSGCRQIVALRLTPANLNAASSWDGFFTVRVSAHKTSRYYGSAHIVLRPFQYKLLILLSERVRDNKSVFGIPENHGRVAEVIFRDFNDFVSEKSGRPFVMRFNSARKVAETFSYILKGLPNNHRNVSACDVVTRFLMHTRATRDLFYHTMTDGEIVSSCRTYQSVFSVLAALEMVREGRIHVPAAEDGKIYNLLLGLSDASPPVLIKISVFLPLS